MDIIRPSSTSRLARNISLIARRLPRATELLSSVDSVPPFSTTGMRPSYHVWTQNAEQGLTSHHARVRTLASASRRRGPDIDTSSRARLTFTHLRYGHYVYYIHYSDIRDNIQDVMNNVMDITNNISLMRDSLLLHTTLAMDQGSVSQSRHIQSAMRLLVLPPMPPLNRATDPRWRSDTCS